MSLTLPSPLKGEATPALAADSTRSPPRPANRNTARENRIFLFPRLSDYSDRMPEFPPEQVTPFVFSDPTGKRWPRLRLILLIAGVLFFIGTVLFVQTLFVTPKMNVPFSLRQLKGPLKASQKENPSNQLSVSSLLWQKFTAAR